MDCGDATLSLVLIVAQRIIASLPSPARSSCHGITLDLNSFI